MPVFEERVAIRAPPDAVFAFLSHIENVPLFAPGIEDAVLLSGERRQGATIGLRTRHGREMRAQITHFHEGSDWTVVDERDTIAQMQVESAPGGSIVHATLKGNWRPEVEKQVRAEWQRLLSELPLRIE